QEIAADLVALCKQGQFNEAGEKYWADDVLSVEPMGDHAEVRGKAGVKAKGEGFMQSHEIHGVEVEGPYVNGDQFVVGFKMDMTAKDTGQRHAMAETALYTLKNGKIAEERFFYGG
ncbi:MAG: SnoaL-like domain-containing protein, partial [Caulobacteraceae bacterium]